MKKYVSSLKSSFHFVYNKRKKKIHLIKGVIFEFLVRLGFNNGREKRLEAKEMSLTIEHLTGGYGHIPVLKDINFDVKSEWCGEKYHHQKYYWVTYAAKRQNYD